MRVIENIDIGRIYEHPQNPRKDLGDLEELAESIRQNGILQPLTVVKCEDGNYTVVMGHRRLGAAKEAGLFTVPCIIEDLTEEEQLAVMLMENMQREDLNALEQADGFQTMMDLGISVKDIAERTGFTQKTVKIRAEWAKLDKDKMTKLLDGDQLNIGQMVKLVDVEEASRDKLLQFVGTKDFDYRLEEAKRDEEWKRIREDWIEGLASFAEEFSEVDYNGTEYYDNISKWGRKPYAKPEDADKRKYYYKLQGNDSIMIRVQKVKSKEEAAEEASRNIANELMVQTREALSDIEKKLKTQAEIIYKLHLDFLRNIKQIDAAARCRIAELYIKRALEDDLYIEEDDICEFYEFKREKTNNFEVDEEQIHKAAEKNPDLVILAILFFSISAKNHESDFWMRLYDRGVMRFPHNVSSDMDDLNSLLNILGYTPGTDEWELIQGTSPIFVEQAEIIKSYHAKLDELEGVAEEDDESEEEEVDK